ADRVLALFRKTGFVDQQQAPPHGQRRAQLPPDPARLPRRVGDEVLQPLIRARVAQPAVQRVDRFALAVVEQASYIPTRTVALDASPETADELIEKSTQAVQQRARGRVVHASQRKEIADLVQVRNFESPRTKR